MCQAYPDIRFAGRRRLSAYRHLRVQRPTISRVTTRLGQAGLLERLPDELDGRGARLRLTPEGRRTLRGLRSRKTAYLAERLERLDPEERTVLAQASEPLERLLEDGGE